MSSSNDIANVEGSVNEWRRTELQPLMPNCIFANRYAIQERNAQTQPHCRFAKDRRTGKEAFLKFFNSSSANYDNAVKYHNLLQNGCPYVCKTIDHYVDSCGLPPCLVMEKGDRSLSDLMEQQPLTPLSKKTLLSHVLKALVYLHNQGIVYGHMHASHIMWFSEDFAWKLVSLGHAGHAEEFSRARHSTPYDPPEMTQALGHHSGLISLEHSMDMWSYGIVAFEVLNHCSVRDPSCLLKYVKDSLDSSHCRLTGVLQRCAVDGGSSGARCVQEWLSLRFVESFLHLDPNARMTATQALQDDFFRAGNLVSPISILHQRIPISTSSTARGFDLKIAIGRQDYHWLDETSHHGTTRTEMQPFGDLSAALEMLPPELIDGHPFLFDIRISSEKSSPVDIRAIHDIYVAAYGGDFVKLAFGQRRLGVDVHAVAAIPCSDSHLLDQQFNMAIDDRGHIRMHLALRICLEVIGRDHVPYPHDLFAEVRGEMILIKRAKGLGRIFEGVKGVWKRLPQGARKCFPMIRRSRDQASNEV